MQKIKLAQKIGSSFKNKDIISLDQFDKKSLYALFKTAQKISKTKVEKIINLLTGKIITLLFFEPSSRTFSSFASAIKRLGGQTIEYQNPLQNSSSAKGETLEDTIRVFETYSDLIIMRHSIAGAAKRAVAAARTAPIINAGDGIGEHPTQALLDLFTIFNQFNRLNNLKGLIAGDLLNGRTVHSLIKGLSNFDKITLYLLSPKELKLSLQFQNEFGKGSLKFIEITNEKEIPDDCNFWYWTRVQKERFANLDDYNRVKSQYVISPELLKKNGNSDMIIMHPLPRVGEIDPAIDHDPRAVYLTKQIRNGLYVRMALLGLVMGRL